MAWPVFPGQQHPASIDIHYWGLKMHAAYSFSDFFSPAIDSHVKVIAKWFAGVIL